MLREALLKYRGLRQQVENVLLGDDGDEWEAELKNFLAKRPCWGKINPVKQLKLVSSVVVFATVGKFIARDNFVVDTKSDALKISVLGDNLIDWFLNGDGKVEEPIEGQVLLCYKLQQFSMSKSIIAGLGGKEEVETTLSEMFSLMKKQGNGETGVLLNNGHANIFCIKDQNDKFRLVFVYWNKGGWHVDAISLENPDGFHYGRQVFSSFSLFDLILLQ
ncbi:hypothetical protein BK005_02300 [bacterium CG10_37_50]|nr:MAG: hypothetical protein BK005_02300 [bacterium CG10_37_50]